MYLAIIGFMGVCWKVGYPPMEVTICWFAFWIGQSVVTMRIHFKKKERQYKERLIDKVEPYLTQDNFENVIEKGFGIELAPKPRPKKRISKGE